MSLTCIDWAEPPTRSGTSQRGEWKALPFVFAYYESGEQRFEDRVMLETFDTNTMKQIAPYCVTDGEGKAVIENGSVKLKTLDIKCRCGFSHNVKDVQKKDGSGTVTINEMRCYKLEIQPVASETVAQQPQQPQTPFPPQAPADDDNLPF